MNGTVYLLGVGPGDPQLLTLRGAGILARADGVVTSLEVPAAFLEHCPADVEVRSTIPGPEAARALMEVAAARSCVVRLYLGDPFLSGAAAEDAAALTGAGIRFEVVPGVPRGLASATYAGYAAGGAADSAVMVVEEVSLDRDGRTGSVVKVLSAGSSAVIATTSDTARELVEELRVAGMPADLPAAVVVRGGTPAQRTYEGGIAQLSWREDGDAGASPATLMVGDFVSSGRRMPWFERRPLFGRRIVVTRARAQAGPFSTALRNLGAEVLFAPMIRIVDPVDPAPLREVVSRAGRFDWIVFASANGVVRFWSALREAGLDTRSLAGVSICAIGPMTAVAVQAEGVRPDLVPEDAVAEGVITALAGSEGLAGSRILLPRAEIGRDVLPRELRNLGAEVVEVIAYRTVADSEESGWLRAELAAGGVDLVTFTSSSTVRNFAELVARDPGLAKIASIGPITSATARELGWRVDIEAVPHTAEGLEAAIVAYYASEARPLDE